MQGFIAGFHRGQGFIGGENRILPQEFREICTVLMPGGGGGGGGGAPNALTFLCFNYCLHFIDAPIDPLPTGMKYETLWTN